MRSYLHIDLGNRSVRSETPAGADIVRAGRYHIARTLLDLGAATADPLGPENPLIFSAGPFAGTNFSNANRLSVGCKSPLTGGIKEANAGGTFAFAMGQLQISGFNLYGAAADWTVVRIPLEGDVTFDDAGDIMGRGNFDAARMLFERYGDKIAIALCGPVGEYRGMLAGIAFTDVEGRPARLAARGGIGAVMGAKKVKAIVIDKHKMPPFHDRKKLMGQVKDYGRRLGESVPVQNMSTFGTAMVGDFTNRIGGLPTRNFSAGRLTEGEETFLLGGDHIHERNVGRGGEPTHACMPGCMIKCSNIYHDKDGKEVVSPMEYETLGLMGSNCGIKDPDDVARLNEIANDLGVDTIETGATLALLLEAGEAAWGDIEFLTRAMEDIRTGNERGRLLAAGAGHVGRHLGLERVPVIKNQAISAYDPRVIEVTGISMMYTAQGADHTTGNLPTAECDGKTTEELTKLSSEMQIFSAAADSTGLCIFGRSVHNEVPAVITDGLNAAYDLDLTPDFFRTEPLAPTDKRARHQVEDINRAMRELLE